MNWRGLVHWLSFWGVWPALLMILCQMEVSSLLATALPLDVALLTLAGTLTVYGLDHGVEAQIQAELALRHRGWPACNRLMIGLLCGLWLAGLFSLQLEHLPWLLGLALSGLLYLMLTWGVLPQLFTLKELLGAWCFTLLVWGSFPRERLDLVLAFFLLGLANFLLSSLQDQERDHANGLRSSALQQPGISLLLARSSGLVAAYLFFGQSSAFFWCAVAHTLWPSRKGLTADWAFLPLWLSLL